MLRKEAMLRDGCLVGEVSVGDSLDAWVGQEIEDTRALVSLPRSAESRSVSAATRQQYPGIHLKREIGFNSYAHHSWQIPNGSFKHRSAGVRSADNKNPVDCIACFTFLDATLWVFNALSECPSSKERF